MLPISKTPQAESDLEEIWRYIAHDNPQAANRLIREIDDVFQRLRILPHSGSPRYDFGMNVRIVPVQRYNVVYRAGMDSIEIIRVLHSARDITALFYKP